MKITYVGPHREGVEIAVTGQECQYQETIEVSDELGAALLEQGPDNWITAASAPKGKPSTTTTPESE